jgi:hypothetical protein
MIYAICKLEEAIISRALEDSAYMRAKASTVTDEQPPRQSTAQTEPAAAPEGGPASVSLDAGELARVNEALLANGIWVKSLHSQLLAKTEALAERDVALARANLALDVQAENLARMGQELDELRAIYASPYWRVIRVLRGASRAANSLMRRSQAGLSLKPTPSPPIEEVPHHDRSTRNLFELTAGARLIYAQIKAALAKGNQRR